MAPIRPKIYIEWAESLIGLPVKIPDNWWVGYTGSYLHDGKIKDFDSVNQKWMIELDDQDDDNEYLIAYDAICEYSNKKHSTFNQYHLPYELVLESIDKITNRDYLIMNTIKTESSSNDDDAMDSFSSINAATTATSIYVKKEEEDHDDGDDVYATTSWSRRIGRQQVKKEEEEEEKDDEDDDNPAEMNCKSNSNENSTGDHCDDGNSYDDWECGNWCRLLPATICKNNNDIKSEVVVEGGGTNTATSPTMASGKRMQSSNGRSGDGISSEDGIDLPDDTDDDDDDDEIIKEQRTNNIESDRKQPPSRPHRHSTQSSNGRSCDGISSQDSSSSPLFDPFDDTDDDDEIIKEQRTDDNQSPSSSPMNIKLAKDEERKNSINKNKRRSPRYHNTTSHHDDKTTTDVEDDDDDETSQLLPRKKKTRLLTHHPPSNNRSNDTVVEEQQQEEEEENICNEEEAKNIDDKVTDDDTDVDVDKGYESWTEGNWCFLLPTGSSSTPTTIKIRTELDESNTKEEEPELELEPEQQYQLEISDDTMTRPSSSTSSSSSFDNDDNDGLSDYEKLRLRNIARNNARLASLGLLSSSTATSTNTTMTKSSSRLLRKKRLKIMHHQDAAIRKQPIRRSLETSHAHSTKHRNCRKILSYAALHADDPDDNAELDESYSDDDSHNNNDDDDSSDNTERDESYSDDDDDSHSNNDDDDSSETSLTNNKRCKQQLVRGKHRRVDCPDLDENNNQCDTDYSDSEDGDEDNDEKMKSRTGRNSMNAYTKMQDKIWNDMFHRLISYKQQHNSTSVPRKYAADPKLGRWVNAQRKHYRDGTMSGYRVNLFNSIGFVWATFNSQWNEMFQRLVTYKKQHHESTLVSAGGYEADTQLGQWALDQRKNYKKENLSVDRIERLESIDFVWDQLEEQWMAMYDSLRAYKNKHKSTQVPRTYAAEGNHLPHLGSWVYRQKSLYKDGKLLEKRVECLNSIDFEWEVKQKDSSKISSTNTSLCVDDQAVNNNNEYDTAYSDSENGDGDDKLKKSRTRKNNTITYKKWQNKHWNDMFRRLVLYKRQYNSTSVPRNYAADLKLGSWVMYQRSQNEAISNHRVDLLNSIGFVWNALDSQWDRMFQRLVRYKKQHHGSTLVSAGGYEVDNQLKKWGDHQRQSYRRENISVDRIKRLESIDFVWDPLEEQWMAMYDRLRAYKNKHKSTQVPRTYTTAENHLPHLGSWVYKQRSLYRNGKSLEKRVEYLNSIDFEWEA